MRCREARILALLYLDRQLDNGQEIELKAHIEICQPCRDKLELMESLPANLETNHKPTPELEFTLKVMQRITKRIG